MHMVIVIFLDFTYCRYKSLNEAIFYYQLMRICYTFAYFQCTRMSRSAVKKDLGFLFS